MPSYRSILSLIAAASFTTLSKASPAPDTATTPVPDQAGLAAVASASAAQASAAYAASAYAAEATGSTSAAGTGAANATGPDQCGPKTPDPTVPDTCGTFVEQVNAPAAYGVQCLHNSGQAALNLTSCENLITILCTQQWQHPGEWLWATVDGCSVGSFLPNNTDAAQPPQEANCEVLIYGAMLETCAGTDSSPYNIASVNLKQLPDNQSTGQQVNPGYPSYLIVPTQPRTVADADGTEPNDIPAAQQIDAAYAALHSAYTVNSAILATMTGTAAAMAQTELAQEYAAAVAG